MHDGKDKELLDSMCRNLADESVDEINFDKLIDILTAMGSALKNNQEIAVQLEYLKNDYRNRIVGMLKANLACCENEEEAALAVRLSGDLSEISADELAGAYVRVAARFRTNFPASFRYLATPSQTTGFGKNWREHKI